MHCCLLEDCTTVKTILQASTKTGHAHYVVNGEMYVKRIEATFNAIDGDGSGGYLDRGELQEMARQLAYTLTEEELDDLMKDMDEDNDGQISLQEFIAATVSFWLVLWSY